MRVRTHDPPPYTVPTDLQLLSPAVLVRQGQFEALFARLETPSFLKAASRLSGPGYGRDDLLQVTRRKIARASHRIDELWSWDRVAAWAWRILLNAARDLHRRFSARKRGGGDTVELDEKNEPADRRTAKEDARRDALEELEPLLRRLPPLKRRLVVLRELCELTYDEIFASTGVPAKRAKSIVHRAVQDMRFWAVQAT